MKYNTAANLLSTKLNYITIRNEWSFRTARVNASNSKLIMDSLSMNNLTNAVPIPLEEQAGKLGEYLIDRCVPIRMTLLNMTLLDMMLLVTVADFMESRRNSMQEGADNCQNECTPRQLAAIVIRIQIVSE